MHLMTEGKNGFLLSLSQKFILIHSLSKSKVLCLFLVKPYRLDYYHLVYQGFF